MSKLFIKTIKEVNDEELKQLNEAAIREFKTTLPPRMELVDRNFFLLFEGKRLLAMGQLIPIEPVFYKGEKFSILGIGAIVSNKKGKGYGRQVMTAIRTYLVSHDKTGVGFCGIYNKGFYEKCRFFVDANSSSRFVYKKGKKQVIGKDCVVHLDGSDRFMEKVLSSPKGEILVPCPPTW